MVGNLVGANVVGSWVGLSVVGVTVGTTEGRTEIVGCIEGYINWISVICGVVAVEVVAPVAVDNSLPFIAFAWRVDVNTPDAALL